MKTRILSIMMGTAILALSFSAFALPCKDGKGGYPWNSKKAEFSLTEAKDSLTLSVTVQGCAGMRSSFQEKLSGKAERANKGESCCASSPFAAKGLKYKIENTELGLTMGITGSAEGRAEFKKLFDARMADRKAGKGCACGKDKGSCGCGKDKASCGCGGAGSCGDTAEFKVEEKGCGCGK